MPGFRGCGSDIPIVPCAGLFVARRSSAPLALRKLPTASELYCGRRWSEPTSGSDDSAISLKVASSYT
jgi:hypothetical protein